MELMERRRILLNTPHTNIITGLQFVTDMVAPLESLVIGFSPIQDLHGYDNPWPAGGGKNLFDKTATDTDNGYVAGKYIGDNDGLAPSANYNVSEYVVIRPSTTYTLSGISGVNPSFVFYDSEKQYISGEKYNGNTSITFTTPDNAGYARMSIPIANIDVLQLELGSTATAYEPYQGTTYPISWQTEAGTVYGGTIDVLSGVLTVTMASVDLGTLDWIKENVVDKAIFRCGTYPVGTRLPLFRGNGVCSQYTWVKVAIVSTLPNMGISVTNSQSVPILRIRDDSKIELTDAEFKTAMSGVQAVYEIYEPVTYQLTPQQVLALKGINNLSMSGQVKFWTHRD